jgi:hypothetical protein
VRLVLVLGAAPQIDSAVEERGLPPEFHGSYRITRPEVLEAAVEAAGRTRTAVERYLSRAPSVPVFRRHAKDDGEMHFGPALNVVRGAAAARAAAPARAALRSCCFAATAPAPLRAWSARGPLTPLPPPLPLSPPRTRLTAPPPR